MKKDIIQAFQKSKKLKKSSITHVFFLSVDSEFTDSCFVSLQLAFYKEGELVKKCFICNRLLLSDKKQLEIAHLCEEQGVECCFSVYDDQTSMIEPIVERFLTENYSPDSLQNNSFLCNLLFFYSFKDLEYSFGFTNLEKHFVLDKPKGSGNWVLQNRSIMGKYSTSPRALGKKLTYRFRDLKGFAPSSLLNFATSLGVPMNSKNDLGEYKTWMDKALIDHTKTFLSYAMGDCLILYPLFQKMIEHTNKILTESYGMPSGLLFSEKKMKFSTGSLVANSFERFLFFYMCGSPQSSQKYKEKIEKVRLAFAKLSVLKISSKNYKKNVGLWNQLFQSDSLEEMRLFVKSHDLQHHSLLTGSAYAFFPYSYASINWFLNLDSKSTSNYNAMVSGGRCNNEKSMDYRFERVLDIDISGCYGSALKAFEYPIGIPCVHANAPNEPQMSLGRFLELYEHELCPNLYKIIVSGKLAFSQDLIYSKIVSPEHVQKLALETSKNFAEGFDDKAHIQGDFVLLQPAFSKIQLHFFSKKISNSVLKRD